MGRSREDKLAPSEISDALSQVFAVHGEARLEAILDLPSPEAIVHAMEPAEAFFTFAQLGEDGKRTLARLLSDEQLDHLLDLDLWQGDRLDVERVLDWLELLWTSSRESVVAWMLRAQEELVVAAINLLCTVTEGPVSAEDSLTEIQDRLPPFTAEGKYYIRFGSERAADALKGPLLLLAGTDLEYYMALLQDVIAMAASEAEEAAYSKRWSRLRDLGFIPPEEAYSIYRWPSKEERSTDSPDESEDVGDAGGGHGVRGTPTALSLVAPQGLLAAALEPLDQAQRLELSRAIAIVSSRVVAADHLPFAELDAHRRALEKTLGYINIGLHNVAGGEIGSAGDALLSQGATNLFRAGYASVSSLGRRAFVLRRQGWLSQIGLGLDVLDEPLASVIRALARPRPLYPSGALEGEGSEREFREPAEVERCAEVIEKVESLKRVFIDGLGLDLAPAKVFDLTGCVPSDPAELTLGLILRTAMAQMVLGDRPFFAAIPSSSLQQLTRALHALENEGIERHIVQTLCARLEDPSEGALHHITSFVEEHFAILVASFAGLQPEEIVDPRFVGAVVVRNV